MYLLDLALAVVTRSVWISGEEAGRNHRRRPNHLRHNLQVLPRSISSSSVD